MLLCKLNVVLKPREPMRQTLIPTLNRWGTTTQQVKDLFKHDTN